LRSVTALKLSDIIKAVAKLRAANNPRWPDGNFPLLLHPLVTYDLKATLSSGYSGAWQDIHKYGTDSMAENLYRGEIGRIYGARIVETTNILRPIGAVGMSANASGWQNLLLAPEAYYVCEMDQMTGRVIVKGLGSAGALDADNSLSTVAAKVFFCPIRGFQASDPNAAGGVETRYIRITTGSTLT
jgi:N4-gp56 family major capsid protein